MTNALFPRLLLAICLALGGVISTATISHAEDVHVPTTAADHLALAKTYQDKATTYHKEAAHHHHMAEAYKKSIPGPSKSGQPNPWAAKMDKHCTVLANDAEKLAVDSEKSAEYHTLRAKELEGK